MIDWSDPVKAWRQIHARSTRHNIDPYHVTYDGHTHWECCRTCDRVPAHIYLIHVTTADPNRSRSTT